MSELMLTPFPGYSAQHINGVWFGTPVFIYDRATPLFMARSEDGESFAYPPRYLLLQGDEIDYANY